MRKKITFGDLASILENYDIVELEDVKITGDVEVELSLRGTIPSSLIQSFSRFRSIVAAAIKYLVSIYGRCDYKIAAAAYLGPHVCPICEML